MTGRRARSWCTRLLGQTTGGLCSAQSFREQFGAFSPNGKWVAYQSNEAGAQEIWLTEFPRRQAKASDLRARRPRAAVAGGRSRAVLPGGDDTLMAAAIGSDLGSVRSVPLFSAGPFPPTDGWHYAVTSDGQKFLVQVGRPDQSRTLHVVFNWPQIVHAAR